MTKTHDTYVKELRARKIKVRPLQPYSGALTKIKHECICGTQWLVMPNKVLQGVKCKICSSNAMRKDKEYENNADELLKARFVERIGEYTHSHAPILFRCLICETQWYARPNRPLQHGCQVCYLQNKDIAWGATNKQIKVGNRTVSVQGYEPQAIQLLLERFTPDKLRFGAEIPIVRLPNGKNHYPDIWIPSANTLVEVKSRFTLGLTDAKRLKHVQYKTLAALAAGHRYWLLLMETDGTGQVLPKAWLYWTRRELEAYLT